jgi:acyl-coenzyme A synthetase/AMP-(fatty) acid ligase
VIYYTPVYEEIVQSLAKDRGMKAIEAGTVENWLHPDPVPAVPYNKTFDEAEWEPLVVLHTSGSTGTPKTVVCKHGMLAIADAAWAFPEHLRSKVGILQNAERQSRMMIPSMMPKSHFRSPSRLT